MGVDLLRDEILRIRQGERASGEEELVDFAESAAEAGAPPPEVETSRVVEGLCALCADRAGTARCAQCEKPVCAEDLWVMYGLCRLCLPEEQLRRARSPAQKERPDLGVKWVDD